MIEPGTIVNRRYRVDRLISEGGMAVVYVGHDLLLGRDVAIKVLRPQYAADPQFRVRFRREAQAAAGFSHPNIIDIYDVGEERGAPYFVMAYVRGQTLKEIIETEGPFHPDDVAGLLQQLGAALDYAHERGYVHRDVKPHNVLIDQDGHATVVDFGIAKGLADADLTEIGTGLGTVHYLSPEQAGGLMATPASDIYAAGVIAFEMLTRSLPFDADSPVGVAMKHLHEPPPPPSDILPSIPPAVDAIVLRALDKDPTRRFPSAGALARAMTYWRQYRPPLPADAASAPTAPLSTPPDLGRTRTTASPVAPAPAVAPPDRRPARAGCATWAVGVLILTGLIGLIVLGFRLSPTIARLGAPTPPPVPATEVPVVAPPVVDPTTIALPTPPPTELPPTAPPPTIASAFASVPDLVGRTPEEAADLLAAQGLTLVEGAPAASDDFPPGTVVFQEPLPGDTLPPGAPVTVRLSSGPAGVDVGALGLVGQTADQAERRLTAEGLTVVRREVGNPEVPAGQVVAVAPDDVVLPGNEVTLDVSVGDLVQIPAALQGEPVNNAARQLERLGLRVVNRYAVNRRTIEEAGIDLDAAGIEDGDLVGIQPTRPGTGSDVEFGGWVEPGTEVDLVFFDRGQGGNV